MVACISNSFSIVRKDAYLVTSVWWYVYWKGQLSSSRSNALLFRAGCIYPIFFQWRKHIFEQLWEVVFHFCRDIQASCIYHDNYFIDYVPFPAHGLSRFHQFQQPITMFHKKLVFSHPIKPRLKIRMPPFGEHDLGFYQLGYQRVYLLKKTSESILVLFYYFLILTYKNIMQKRELQHEDLKHVLILFAVTIGQFDNRACCCGNSPNILGSCRCDRHLSTDLTHL